MPAIHFLKTSLFIVWCLTGLNALAAELTPEVIEKLKPKLNSERVEDLFGNYGIEPYQLCSSYFAGSRISNLYSTHNKQKIMRALGIVDFEQIMSPALIPAHKKILAGSSIGGTLRNTGWTVIKKPIYFGETPLSGKVMKAMNESLPTKAALYIYQLNVLNTDYSEPIPYCRVIEIYSPQYITSDLLKTMYDKEYPLYDKANAPTTELLEQIEKCIKEQ